jgi:hypothetical protein
MSIALYLLIAFGLFALAVPLVNAAIAHSERMAERRMRSRRPMDGASCH